MIPANNAAEEKEEREEEEEEEQQQQQQQLEFHVLVVDDDPTQRKISECLLQKSSHRVTCVDSGHKALEFLASFHTSQHQDMKVNLIMTDYYMPGMTGFDLLKRIKRSAWKDVPVVVVSSENVSSRISMCLKEGAEAFLLKPLKPVDIQNIRPLLLRSVDRNHLSRTETNDSSSLVATSDNGSISQIKALPPDSSADQRIKLEELAVV